MSFCRSNCPTQAKTRLEWATRPKPSLNAPPNRLLLIASVLENFLGEVVFYLGLVAEDLVVSRLEQLLATFAELLADGLLHPWIVEIALAGGLLGQNLDDAVAKRFMSGGIHYADDAAVLAGLETGNSFAGSGVSAT